MSAIMFDDTMSVVLTREEIMERISNTGRCSKCFSCELVNKVKNELNKQGFLNFNENVKLWKIEYNNGNLKGYPVYEL